MAFGKKKTWSPPYVAGIDEDQRGPNPGRGGVGTPKEASALTKQHGRPIPPPEPKLAATVAKPDAPPAQAPPALEAPPAHHEALGRMGFEYKGRSPLSGKHHWKHWSGATVTHDPATGQSSVTDAKGNATSGHPSMIEKTAARWTKEYGSGAGGGMAANNPEEKPGGKPPQWGGHSSPAAQGEAAARRDAKKDRAVARREAEESGGGTWLEKKAEMAANYGGPGKAAGNPGATPGASKGLSKPPQTFDGGPEEPKRIEGRSHKEMYDYHLGWARHHKQAGNHDEARRHYERARLHKKVAVAEEATKKKGGVQAPPGGSPQFRHKPGAPTASPTPSATALLRRNPSGNPGAAPTPQAGALFSEHREGDKVISGVNEQGLKKGQQYTVHKVETKYTPFGGVTAYHVKDNAGNTHRILNGHLVLSKAAEPTTEQAKELFEGKPVGIYQRDRDGSVTFAGTVAPQAPHAKVRTYEDGPNPVRPTEKALHSPGGSKEPRGGGVKSVVGFAGMPVGTGASKQPGGNRAPRPATGMEKFVEGGEHQPTGDPAHHSILEGAGYQYKHHRGGVHIYEHPKTGAIAEHDPYRDRREGGQTQIRPKGGLRSGWIQDSGELRKKLGGSPAKHNAVIAGDSRAPGLNKRVAKPAPYDGKFGTDPDRPPIKVGAGMADRKKRSAFDKQHDQLVMQGFEHKGLQADGSHEYHGPNGRKVRVDPSTGRVLPPKPGAEMADEPGPGQRGAYDKEVADWRKGKAAYHERTAKTIKDPTEAAKHKKIGASYRKPSGGAELADEPPMVTPSWKEHQAEQARHENIVKGLTPGTKQHKYHSALVAWHAKEAARYRKSSGGSK